MNIEGNVFVSMDYRLFLESGEEVDASPEGKPIGFVTGSGQIIPGLEKALTGMSAGDSTKVTLDSDDGYGPVKEDLFQEIPRSKFPEEAKLEPGEAFQAQGPHGPVMIRVAKVNDNDTVTIDLNHPMAGKRLVFDVTIVEVREPKEEELSKMTSGCGCGPDGGPDGGGEGQGGGCPSGCDCG